MKKIALTASILGGLVLSAAAQQTKTVSMTKNAGTTVGIHAGVNMFNINGKNASGVDLDNGLKTGFSAGVDVAVPLGGGFYVQPGVSFVQKGTETNNNLETTLNYIDIPVNFVYKPLLGSGNLILGAGPYVGFGIDGNVEDANGNETEVQFRDEFDRSLPASTTQLRKSDAGINLLAGYEFANNLSITLKSQLGLKDINPDMGNAATNDQTRFRNTGFGLSIGYRF